MPSSSISATTSSGSLQGAQHDLAVIDHLYRLAMERGDLAIAEQVAEAKQKRYRTDGTHARVSREVTRVGSR
jgi:hypothetical protein